MATDLADVLTRMPLGLRARIATDGDIERIVEFTNRYATPGQWQSPASAREMNAVNPEPLRRALIAEEERGDVQAIGSVSNGGMWAPPDGSWRVGMRVAPAWRRKGVGRAFLPWLEEHARANGARRTVAAVRGDEPDGMPFASAMGYRAFHERIDSYIDVHSFDASAFEDPDAIASRAGVRLATYEELKRDHASGLEAIQREMLPAIWAMARDVPSPTPMPEQPPPFEQAKRMFFEGSGIDPPSTVIALRDGRPVGITATMVKENGSAHTNFTGVARAERGKGLALAMKLRALRALRERGVRLFGTTNDEQNAAMRGINRRLGYKPEPPTTMVEKKLT